MHARCIVSFFLEVQAFQGEYALHPPPLQVGEFGGDNRAGIDGTLHRISAIRNRVGRVVGLTCRVGRAVPGGAQLVADLVQNGRSMLIMGTSGGGRYKPYSTLLLPVNPINTYKP